MTEDEIVALIEAATKAVREVTESLRNMTAQVEDTRASIERLRQHISKARGEHVLFVCTCVEPGCQFCDGGLGWCTECDGFEGTLPTHCPGVKMTDEQKESVWRHKLDFVDGKWNR